MAKKTTRKQVIEEPIENTVVIEEPNKDNAIIEEPINENNVTIEEISGETIIEENTVVEKVQTERVAKTEKKEQLKRKFFSVKREPTKNQKLIFGYFWNGQVM